VSQVRGKGGWGLGFRMLGFRVLQGMMRLGCLIGFEGDIIASEPGERGLGG
jgi:hypothetical protein